MWHPKTGDTAIHLACRFGRADLLAEFSCAGLDLQISNFEGKKPLHEAAQFDQSECVKFLLTKGCEVDCIKRGDWTPLMLACTRPQLDVVKLLVYHGANPAFVNKDGWNSFHIATSYPPDATDSCGSTPLMDALRAGFVDVAHLLIQHHKADVTKRDNLGMQPIHHAAQAGQTAAVMFLITQYTIPVNAVTHTTLITPLQVAAKEGHNDVLKSLLLHGADISLTDHKGRTALHIASGAQHASSVALLLANGAQDCSDLSGHWAKDLAYREGVKQAFLNHGA
ncbi:hypothetical protein C0Q70_15696 [Pomacea canaliculata]|uniref:Uncharacterized protein n=1 Tax=Pomacea canaliculata TaxID=400727 RepID=A0A2T7NVJ6_POMCA|nr:hypothetical protein C0Q70_15696 [Pomacea canaliculata]